MLSRQPDTKEEEGREEGREGGREEGRKGEKTRVHLLLKVHIGQSPSQGATPE